MPDDSFVVTPWRVEGRIDYDRLVTKFGTERMTDGMLARVRAAAGGDHFMLRRGVFFSHRGMGGILDSHQSGAGFFLYTGRGPSGHTHIGHLLPWVFAKWLQDRFGARMYFQLADDEKFYSREDLSLEQASRFADENALDFAALGFDPEKTRIIVNTRDAGRLYPLAAQVAKKINFSNTKATFGFSGSTGIGMIFYTALQSAPCFLEDSPVLIPLGVDQDPHFRLTRDVAPRLGRPKPALVHNVMLPPLDGTGGKMSASDPNGTIYTTDGPQAVRKKITKYAFSGGRADSAEHRRLGGDPEIDVSYQYLRMFFEPGDSELEKIREQYASGAMLTGELKQILVEKINSFLGEHQRRREELRGRMGEFMWGERGWT